MKTVTVELDEPSSNIWKNLPTESQKLLTGNMIKAILNGSLYPTGVEQLELAIDLAESGVDPAIISQLSRLDRSVFEGFLK